MALVRYIIIHQKNIFEFFDFEEYFCKNVPNFVGIDNVVSSGDDKI